MFNNNKTLNNLVKFLGFIAFSGGFVLYLLSYLHAAGNWQQIVTSILRAILSTARMFILSDDFQTISAILENQAMISAAWFLISYWTVHVLALVVSVIVIISILAGEFIEWLRRICSWNKDIFIICGVNEASLCFADNIKSGQRYVIFIDEDCDELCRQRIKSMGCAVINLPFAPANEKIGSLLRKAGVKRPNADKHIYLFAFSEDFINNAIFVSKALSSAQEAGLPPTGFKVYAMLEEGIVSRSIEKMSHDLKVNYDIQFFNVCDLSARQLINNAPPSKTIDFDPGTGLPLTGYERFKVVMVGFGPMGQQVFKYLLCNAQFEGCRFEAVIIDKDIHNITGQFKYRHPGIFSHYPIIAEECEVFNESFYDLLNIHALDANYIVIALGDDHTNLEAAADIDTMLSQNIPSNEKYRCSTILAVNVKNREHIIEGTLSNDRYILFGQYESIFSEDVIINASLDAAAVEFHKNYCIKKYEHDNTQKIISWEELNLTDRNSNRMLAAFVPAYAKIMGLDILYADYTGEGPLISRKYQQYLNDNPVLQENLSRTEHKRWQAYYFSQGWETMPVSDIPIYRRHKDFDRKRHACLAGWDELDEVSRQASRVYGNSWDFKAYDFNNIMLIYQAIILLNRKMPAK